MHLDQVTCAKRITLDITFGCNAQADSRFFDRPAQSTIEIALQSVQGRGVPAAALTCRLRVDSSSLMPPLRKWMPGTAGGMLRSIVRAVYLATSSGAGVGTSRPAAVQKESSGWPE